MSRLVTWDENEIHTMLARDQGSSSLQSVQAVLMLRRRPDLSFISVLPCVVFSRFFSSLCCVVTLLEGDVGGDQGGSQREVSHGRLHGCRKGKERVVHTYIRTRMSAFARMFNGTDPPLRSLAPLWIDFHVPRNSGDADADISELSRFDF